LGELQPAKLAWSSEHWKPAAAAFPWKVTLVRVRLTAPDGHERRITSGLAAGGGVATVQVAVARGLDSRPTWAITANVWSPGGSVGMGCGLAHGATAVRSSVQVTVAAGSLALKAMLVLDAETVPDGDDSIMTVSPAGAAATV
jgi:hypothetical protein